MGGANPAIEITSLRSVSPSSAELLRICMLRAGLSASRQAQGFVLGNPKAWLGSAYHAVLAEATRPSPEPPTESCQRAWDAAVAKQYERAKAHPLDSRFGPPDKWPGYHLIAAMALERAKRFCAESKETKGTESGDRTGQDFVSISERRLTACEEKLVGRPDLLKEEVVIDFKTGTIYDDADPEKVKDAYIRQLKLYGYLVHENLGWWPKRGVLLPMTGPPVAVQLQPGECIAEAQAAILLLDAYNSALLAEGAVEELSSPSAAACKWCPFQVICPSFWGAATAEWSSAEGPVAITGPLSEEPQQLHGGACRLTVSVTAGTLPQSTVQLAPLDSSAHFVLRAAHKGTEVRATGLYKRTDGSVVPTKRSIIISNQDVPAILVAQHEVCDHTEE